MSDDPLQPTPRPRAYAVIPAAGASRRMGSDKLLLPWEGGLLIDAVIRAWQAAPVDGVCLVAHPKHSALIERCRGLGAEVVVPGTPPAEMKDSVLLALEFIRRTQQPCEEDLWLLAPADMPNLSPLVARQVINAAAERPGRIVVPCCGKRQGHPAAFPWALASQVARLGPDEGVNALLDRHRVARIDCGPEATPPDIDTPNDYRRLRDR